MTQFTDDMIGQENQSDSSFGMVGIILACCTCAGLATVLTAFYLTQPSALPVVAEEESISAADAPVTGAKNQTTSEAASSAEESTISASKAPNLKSRTVVAADQASGPVYNLKVGDTHTYDIRISSSQRGFSDIKKQCVYEVMNGTKDKQDTKAEASGSGFVVTADGYVATCAHVVARATTVTVRIDGKLWPATKVAENPEADLALLKIDAQNLNVCPLGDSDQVELAETVRAFGFPLSTVLGTDLKVVTGSVSGIMNDPKTGRRIQTDAAINRGNSGGPLVNESGQVIGLASSMLSSRVASAVGLGVPVNELRKLLKDAKVHLDDPAPTEIKSGPDIVRTIRPGIAFIETRGINGKVFDLNFRVRSNSNHPFARANVMLAMSAGSRDRPDGEMKLSQFGEVVDQTGNVDTLPFLLGPTSQFCIAPLDYLGRSHWSAERQLMLQLQNSGPTDLLSLMLQRHAAQSPFATRRKEEPAKLVAAEETVNYERMKPNSDGTFVIKKEYHLVTMDNEENPGMEIEGTGETVFDPAVGVAISGTYNAKITRRFETRTDVTPVKAEFQHFSSEQIAKTLADNTETTTKVNPDGSKVVTTITKTPHGTFKKVTTTGGPDNSIKTHIAPVEQNGNAAATTADSTPPTDEELDTAVLDLDELKTSFAAKRLLRNSKAAGEEAILRKYHELQSASGRSRATSLLTQVGTEKSIPFLKELVENGEFGAKSTLFHLESRVKFDRIRRAAESPSQ